MRGTCSRLSDRWEGLAVDQVTDGKDLQRSLTGGRDL